MSYTVFMITVCFGGPCFTMTFCYYKILKTFRKSSSRLFGGNRPIFAKPCCFGRKMSDDSSSQSLACAETSESKGSELITSAYREAPKVVSPCYQSANINVTVQPKPVPVSPIQGTQLSQITLSSASNKGTQLSPSTVSPPNEEKQLCPVALPTSGQRKQFRRATSAAPPIQVTQRRRITINSQLDDNSNIQLNRQQIRRRNEEFVLSAALLLVIFVFIICWLPFCITMFITVFSPNEVPKQADMFTLMLGYINSCCNPIIYGFLNKRFKAGYLTFFKRMCLCCRMSSASVDVDAIATVSAN